MAVLNSLLRILFSAAAFAPALAMAADPVQLCPGQAATPEPDGRVLGHIPYAEAPASELVTAPAWFAIGPPCRVQREMLPDLLKLLSAATATPGVGRTLRAVSCFRTVAHQREVFCSQIGPKKRCKDAAERARFVGPPGYSEHSTGYAIDFGVRPSPGCVDVDLCIATTPAGEWLIAHAPDYGFELSFPSGNAQGVTWEPWHWRWVGTGVTEPGAARARLTVARARAQFPALPAVTDRPTTPYIVPPPTDPGVPLGTRP
jgi:D-alanyl-D-alanine carboxypeptidase